MKIHTALICQAMRALNWYLSARVYWYHSSYNSLDPENFVTYKHKYTALQIKAIWYSKAKGLVLNVISCEINGIFFRNILYNEDTMQWITIIIMIAVMVHTPKIRIIFRYVEIVIFCMRHSLIALESHWCFHSFSLVDRSFS